MKQRTDINGQMLLPMHEWVEQTTDRPDLTEWDVILVNTSGGKDSQAMLGEVVRLAEAQGVRDRLIAVHAELGRVEWEGTVDLARTQADAYGVEFRAIRRPQGDLLEHVEKRGMWPSFSTRYCTSDHKRGQIAKVVTALDRERRTGDSFSVLNCMGLRAEESSARRKKKPLTLNKAYTTKSRRVYDWLPIHDWTEREVWESIEASGVPYHPAYDIGMPRLSCVFCIYAPKPALVLAARHNPDLLNEYVRVEREIGHRFRVDTSMAEVQEALTAAPDNQPITGAWNM